jgi:hypothetical protein
VNDDGSKTLKVVHLVLTYHWFDEMVNLRKHVEYRAMTPHWKRLIWDRRNEIAAARFSRGYTAETILRPIIGIDVGPCPYNGWEGDYYRLTLGLITEHNQGQLPGNPGKRGRKALAQERRIT